MPIVDNDASCDDAGFWSLDMHVWAAFLAIGMVVIAVVITKELKRRREGERKRDGR